MSSTLPTGFLHLPISSVLTTWIIIVPLVVSILEWKPMFILSYDPFVSKWAQYWRFVLFQLQFQNESQVMLCVTLIVFSFKNLERVFGSIKYLRIVCLLFLYNMVAITLLTWSAYTLLGINIFVPAGPFGMVFGLLYAHWKYTPILYKFELNFGGLIKIRSSNEDFKLVFTNDFLTSLLAFQLLISEGLISSVIVSVVGYFIGSLLFNGLLPGLNARISLMELVYNKITAKKSRTTTTRERTTVDEDEQADQSDEREDTPARTLSAQILDTFRR
ncbi:hypothetical protein OGAPHI_007127 [Ogataea philodendri]|uniref:Uncharacterized protein n=1 Tax=Ogataea philodendri TaxID=1378263 RepID=A0A9P8SZL6_9ASCO|nr:uncharacterized protein OGAPHI_007127 [Ogataea philodendri]KAH3660541.1 hypothetical protein OGAPHI_007127 [Ogataea philodendri]